MKTLILDDKFFAVDDLVSTMERIDPEGEHVGFTSTDEAFAAIERRQDLNIIFLDIDMPRHSGIQLAERIQAIRPEVNIIFVTGHPDYALPVHEMYVSGFLVKPVSEERLRKALEHLRFPIGKPAVSRRIRVQALGNFEVFVDGAPLEFRRSRTKELLAYLIDRRGAGITNGELLSALWEDGEPSESNKSYLRMLIKELRDQFDELGLGEFVVRGRNTTAVNTDMVDCDYYTYLEEHEGSMKGYTGEYMSQYEWAEYSLALL